MKVARRSPSSRLRQALSWSLALLVLAPPLGCSVRPGSSAGPPAKPAADGAPPVPSAATAAGGDDLLLADLERRTFSYF